ncbi:MAG: PH domain-containing protein, partial [Acidobacteriota bacterium]
MQSEQRLHPLSFLFAIGSNLRASLIPILVAVFAARSYDAFFIFLGIPVAAWAFVRYLSYRYVFAEDDLVIRTGFLFRNERHIPYGRIHNLNAIQNPFHRLFGV